MPDGSIFLAPFVSSSFSSLWYSLSCVSSVVSTSATDYLDLLICESSSSRMRVINHNWSATKQLLHLQSVAKISCHSVLLGDRIRQCGTLSGSCHKTQIGVCKSPFPSAGTAVSLFHAKTVQQRPVSLREVETQLPGFDPIPIVSQRLECERSHEDKVRFVSPADASSSTLWCRLAFLIT